MLLLRIYIFAAHRRCVKLTHKHILNSLDLITRISLQQSWQPQNRLTARRKNRERNIIRESEQQLQHIRAKTT